MRPFSWLSRPGDVSGRGPRLSLPIHSDKRGTGSLPAICLLGCLVLVVLVISASTVASGANFVQSSSNPGNIFTAAGTFRLLNSVEGGYVIDVAGLGPGQSATGTLTLTCEGDLKGLVSMENGGITNTPSSPALSATLTLRIEDITGSAQTLWSGTMSSFSSLALNQFSAGETRTYRFTVTFPQSGGVPELQGATTAMQIDFVGVAQ